MNKTTLLEAALNYADKGYPVFPLRGKEPALSNMGKGFSKATTDPDLIAEWWSGANFNIGIPTGPTSRFWALDVDNKRPEANGLCSLATLVAEHGDLPSTAQQITGMGRHYLFRYEDTEIKNSVCDIGPGLDVRGKGGYIVASPSRHPETGQQYRWVEGSSPFETEIVKAPEWLSDLVRKREKACPTSDQLPVESIDQVSPDYARLGLIDECCNIENAPDGMQEITLNKAALISGRWWERGYWITAKLVLRC